jgi:hypothetical protein
MRRLLMDSSSPLIRKDLVPGTDLDAHPVIQAMRAIARSLPKCFIKKFLVVTCLRIGTPALVSAVLASNGVRVLLHAEVTQALFWLRKPMRSIDN